MHACILLHEVSCSMQEMVHACAQHGVLRKPSIIAARHISLRIFLQQLILTNYPEYAFQSCYNITKYDTFGTIHRRLWFSDIKTFR